VGTVRPAPRRTIIAQGNPRAVYERAIERGNLLVAETVLRSEIPRPTLADLLELVALIAVKDPRRHGRAAARWVQRWLEREPDATVDDIAYVAVLLQALGGRRHGHALDGLRELATRLPSGSISTQVRPSSGRSTTESRWKVSSKGSRNLR
jgi:hypothetical protein